MKIKTELEKMNESDINSLILFALYQSTKDPETAALSQLAYILDRDNLIRLCQFFGGITLKIPTLEELEVLIYSLLMFQCVDIEHRSVEDVEKELCKKDIPLKDIQRYYLVVKDMLKNYKFNSGRE